MSRDKEFIFIVSCIRSGSTLLKSLLCQHDEADYIPEFNFAKLYGLPENQVVEQLSALSEKRFIILKWPHDDGFLIPLLRAKVIFLFRQPIDTTRSIYRMYKSEKPKDLNSSINLPPFESSDVNFFKWCANRWMKTNGILLGSLDFQQHDVRMVNFDDLVRDPVSVTGSLFSHFGFKNTYGVSSYQMPTHDGAWTWGVDDGGEKIKSLRVQKDIRLLDAESENILQRIILEHRVIGFIWALLLQKKVFLDYSKNL